MPLIVETSTEGSQNSGDTMAVNVPAGTVDDDLLLFFIIGRDPNSLVTLNDPTNLTQVWQTDVASNFMSGGCWRRVASSEPASYTWTVGSGGNGAGYGVGVRITGYDAGNIIDVSGSSIQEPGTGLAPDVTTTIDGVLLFRWYCCGGSQSQLGTNPAAHTQVQIGADSGSSVAGLLSYETSFPDSGAQGTQAIVAGVSRWRIAASVAVAAFIDIHGGGFLTSDLITSISAPTGAFGALLSSADVTAVKGSGTRWGAIASGTLLENV